ncbi:hypothetical protein F5Y14DRAFT_444409 [Nemania sp. NC0429]|nr:hypothetical protein F5Y14DRAFT_444409 [Nemania sp. NC0429]
MFGLNTNTTSQGPAAGSLFGSAQPAANTSTPKPASLFGTPAASSQPSQQPPSLFAASTTANATTTTQPQPTSLFASTASAQPQQTGGLFGGAPAQNPTQSQPQTQTAGGLFGNLNATSQANTGATSTPSLFGGNAAAAGSVGQTAQQRPSLFAGTGQQAQTQPAQTQQPSIFGQPQQQQNQQQSQQPAVGFGGGLGFGLTMGQPNAQSTVPGVRIDISNLKGTTRFNDLQEDLQKIIEQADNFIAEQVRRKEEVDSFMSGHREMLESIPNDVAFVARKYDGAKNALQSAAQSIEAARVLVSHDADHARLSFRAIDNLKLPQQYHTSGFWSPRQQASGNANAETDGQDLVAFFSRTADEMADQMKKYEGNLTAIEEHMHGVSDSLVDQLQRMMAAKNGGSSNTDEKIQELVAVLRDFEQGILRVATDVGSVREDLTQLQVGDFMNPGRSTHGVY